MKRFVFILTLLSLLLCGCVRRGTTAAEISPSAPAPVEACEPTPVPEPEDDLRISEVLTNTRSVVTEGRICDWAELYNADSHPVELGSYTLRKDGGAVSSLPERTLQPGEYVLLLCGRDISFNFSKDGVELALLDRNGAAACTLSVPALEPDESFTAEYGTVSTPTPGTANSDTAQPFHSEDGLYISEVVSSNSRFLPQGMEYYDLIELRWGGSGSVLLSDYFLSDSANDLPGWQLPSVRLNTGECYTVQCTGSGSGAPFSVSADGETLFLCASDGSVTDALYVPPLPANRSYGRENGRNMYFAVPTVGSVNCGGTDAITPSPVASVPSGVYDGDFTVTLSGPGEIRYTVNGSDPTHGDVYQGEEIPVSGIMAIRAVAFDGDRIPSGIVTWNYMIGMPEHCLDVVMISLNPGLFGTDLSAKRSLAEDAANVALYVNGEEQFNQPCGMSILGSGSRLYEKKSYQISFRAEYGPSRLHYKLFEDREQDCFSAFNLRSGSQDLQWCVMRDELLTGLWEDLGSELLTFAYRPVDLYVNGEYRGIYYIRERCSKETVAEHDGVDKDTVDILRSVINPAGGKASDDWFDLVSYIRTHDLSVPANYDYVCSLLDMDSTADYLLAQMWSTNFDLNNARVYRSQAEDGRWRFILYDLDVALLKSNAASVQNVLDFYPMTAGLLQSPEFREKLTLRLGELLSGPLAEETVIARVDAFTAMLGEDLKRNCERWDYLNSYENCLSRLEQMKYEPGVGIADWNSNLIRQFIAAVKPDRELIIRAFGEEYA